MHTHVLRRASIRTSRIKMGREEELVARDFPEFLRILEEIKDKVPMVTQHMEQLSEMVARSDTSTENGISLLEVKVHLLLSSLVNLTQLMLMKTEGQSINTSPPVLRLVEVRTVLEKLRPLDQKLRYQVDKLIRTAQTGISAANNDPLRYRANPANMVSKLSEDKDQSDMTSDEGEGEEETSKLYVPPRLVATPYDGEEGEEVREKRQRKKIVRSSIVHELRNEYLDLPEEVNDVGHGMRSRREVIAEKEREKFEEANFVRLPGKRKVRRSDQMGGAGVILDDLMDVGDSPSSSWGRKRRRVSMSARGKARRGVKSKRRRRH